MPGQSSHSVIGASDVALPTRVIALATDESVPLYETASDNWAMSTSNPDGFYALVQADTSIHERGWNAKMAAQAYVHEDVFAIGGRCGGGAFTEGLSSAPLGTSIFST